MIPRLKSRDLLSNRHASAIACFGLSFLPAIIFGGGAIDCGRALRIMGLQKSALHATASQLAPLAHLRTAAQLSVSASAAIARMGQPINLALTSDPKVDATKICITGASSVNTSVLSVVGIPALEIISTACAPISEASIPVDASQN